MEKSINQCATQRHTEEKPKQTFDARSMAEVLTEMGKMNSGLQMYIEDQGYIIAQLQYENKNLSGANTELGKTIKRFDESLDKMTLELRNERKRYDELSNSVTAAKVTMQAERIQDLMALLTEERLNFKKNLSGLNTQIELRDERIDMDRREKIELKLEGERLARLGAELEEQVAALKQMLRKKATKK